MTPNLRALVAKAYRVRQGRTFSSSSSAPNPIDDKVGNSIVRYLVSRGFVTLTGYGTAAVLMGYISPEFDEEMIAIDKKAVDFLEKRGKLPPGSLDAMYKSGHCGALPKQNQPL